MTTCNACGHTWAVTADNGGPLDQASLDVLLATIQASDARAVVNGWLAQANDAGESWSPRTHPYVRQYEIARAAYALAVASDGVDDYARLMLFAATDSGSTFFPVGRILGQLDIPEARRVHAVAEAFGQSLHLIYDEAGIACLDGDVDDVLRRVA